MISDHLIFNKHLEKGEKILFAAHKHWSEFAGPFLKVFTFGLALPWGLYWMGFRSKPFFLFVVAWSLLALLKLFYEWIDWYSDTWLFTSMSIIIIEWHGIFSNTSQRIGYEDTEGVSFVIKGFWGSILRYGDVTLMVISGSHVRMKRAARPKKIELALMKHQGDYLAHKEFKDATGLKHMLAQMVQHHMRQKK